MALLASFDFVPLPRAQFRPELFAKRRPRWQNRKKKRCVRMNRANALLPQAKNTAVTFAGRRDQKKLRSLASATIRLAR
jgi:hypothetical protein